jgi:hypothetical protein
MKKSEMLIGLGFSPKGDEDEEYDYEGDEDEDATEKETEADEAIDTFLDANEDIEVRREAFRRAIKLCSDY